MSRIIGLVLFVVIVMAAVGGYHVRAQESATLETRVAALQTQVADLESRALPPPSPHLNPGNGQAIGLRESFADGFGVVFICTVMPTSDGVSVLGCARRVDTAPKK